ncbi:MAG: helix-turn-helix transcriptional regulator [Proteobacteria bacterium]|nr:helix-turn-helix transcriptional regulator [Pseudomonadota bacterium]MCH8173000.1 helix-turn-helix transcriptional regulator [Pseudomonadota bacterium]MCH8322494.1 helix-turn-helix transcriptional regulator [Pseudomonadota bacterium]
MSTPDPIDIHVGSRVRMRRTLLGMSQEKLGNALGLTFQQIQKYERGANRIGSSRLYKLSHILDVPVGYFFEDMQAETVRRARGLSDTNPETFEQDQLAKRETLELVRAYYKISDPKVRKKTFELVKAVAQSGK